MLPGEEQSQAALFVQCVRPGIGRRELQAIRETLANLELQSVVIGNALRREQDRIHVIADVGHANRRVARELTRRDGFQIEIEIRAYAAVGIDLSVDGVLRRGDLRLIERNRQHFDATPWLPT